MMNAASMKESGSRAATQRATVRMGRDATSMWSPQLWRAYREWNERRVRRDPAYTIA